MKPRKDVAPGKPAEKQGTSAPQKRQPDGDGAPVVAIGASAGGLEALRDLFAAAPPDSGMAFVIVQHLDPSYESRTAEILAKYAAMPVIDAADGLPVVANSVYAIPSGKYAAIDQGILRLSDALASDGIRKPIDFFFASLADERLDKAVGIILSGSSGTDGLRGARAIRAVGGICLVQDPWTAQFPQMPQSIIDAGLADYILPVGKMLEALLAYARTAPLHAFAEDEAPAGPEAEGLEAILKLLQVRASGDYRHYKRATLMRRLRRRMGLKSAADTGAYLKVLEDDPKELEQLAGDLLISVSSFFRDAGAFEEYRRDAIDPLVKARDSDASVRAWVAGCATGEEAYSVAMLLLDAVARAGKACPVQVFASDVDEKALSTARAGVYSADIAEDVSEDYLKRYFTKRDDSWQVNKRLRDTVIFSRHNLLVDPPFSKLDLVCCRNVLIYLLPAAQKKILTAFSFSLNLGGYLFLGKSEGIAGVEEGVFEPVSRQKRIYRLACFNRRATGGFPLYAGGRAAFAPRGAAKAQPLSDALDEAGVTALLRHFDAGIVLVDPTGRILYFHGQTEKYLGHPKGPATLNLLDMTAGRLSASLRRAMKSAIEKNEMVFLPRISLGRPDAPHANLTVMPVDSPELGGQVLAVIFEDAPTSRHIEAAPVSAEDQTLVAQLDAEVKALRDELQAGAEAYGSAAEDLNAANEEMTSMNEELQSANEELEASKEELQSLNEELSTVNSQLNDKVEELTATNNDLANLPRATQIATVFLDRQLQIKRFTPRATDVLNLITSDMGRPLSHITQNFVGASLVPDAEAVLKDLSVVEKEVRTRDGRWFAVRVLPYRTLDDRIEGVVITFSDVTRLKDAENRLEYEKMYAEGIVETVRDPLIVLDDRSVVLSANRAFYEMFQFAPEETAGRQIFDLGGREWDIPRLRELLQDVIPKQVAFRDLEVECEFRRIGRKTLLLNGRRIERPDGRHILLCMEDVTERKKDREALRSLNDDLERRVTERTAVAEAQARQLRDLAAELTRTEQRERERLARLLHDDLQQILVGARFQLSLLRLEDFDTSSRGYVEQVDHLIQEAIRSSRSLTAELSPTILYEAGLDAALPWLARQMKVKYALDVRTDINTSVLQDEEGVVILLFQAVRELLFNVVKHARVTAARVELDRVDDDHVRVVVSDEGAGFDPSVPKDGTPGESGMGLFGVYERIRYVGGTVEIGSAPGRGTRITLTAPVRRQGEPEQATGTLAPLAALPPLAGLATGTRRTRVLIADDHTIVRQGISSILRRAADIEIVAEADNGKKAVEVARRLRPDVIIMDISMPEMNGIEATRVIHSELPDTRVIGLSMHENADGAAAMHEAGASAFLTKDGPADDLLAAIRKGQAPASE